MKSINRAPKDKDHPYSCWSKSIEYKKEQFKDYPRAFAIWIYLLSLPDDWKISQTQLANHFNKSRHWISDGMKELIKQGFISNINTAFFRNEIPVQSGIKDTNPVPKETFVYPNRMPPVPIVTSNSPNGTLLSNKVNNNITTNNLLSDQQPDVDVPDKTIEPVDNSKQLTFNNKYIELPDEQQTKTFIKSTKTYSDLIKKVGGNKAGDYLDKFYSWILNDEMNKQPDSRTLKRNPDKLEQVFGKLTIKYNEQSNNKKKTTSNTSFQPHSFDEEVQQELIDKIQLVWEKGLLLNNKDFFSLESNMNQVKILIANLVNNYISANSYKYDLDKFISFYSNPTSQPNDEIQCRLESLFPNQISIEKRQVTVINTKLCQ